MKRSIETEDYNVDGDNFESDTVTSGQKKSKKLAYNPIHGQPGHVSF